MTIFSVAGAEPVTTVRYVPAVAWIFAALSAYGVGDIVARMLDGRLSVTAGTLGALALLVGFALFALYTGGEIVAASFDRRADRILVRRYGITGATSTERRLSDLAGLEIRVLRRSQHRVELRFASGERLPLTSYYVVTFNTRALRRLGERLGIEPTLAEPTK
jgi:hypothetical protein